MGLKRNLVSQGKRAKVRLGSQIFTESSQNSANRWRSTWTTLERILRKIKIVTSKNSLLSWKKMSNYFRKSMIWGNKSILWRSASVRLRRKFLSCTKECMRRIIPTSRSLKRDQRPYKQRSKLKVTTNWVRPSKTLKPLTKKASTWKMN